MIIIVGMDNSGKTTLGKGLKEKLKCELVKSPGPLEVEEQREWVMEQLIKVSNLNLKGEQIIFERFAILEELVYGTVLRNKSNYSYKGVYMRLLKGHRPTIIYTRPSNADILNFGDRPQMKGVIEDSQKLIATFDELMFKMLCDGWNVAPYNYRINTPDDVIRLCEIKDRLLMLGNLGGRFA